MSKNKIDSDSILKRTSRLTDFLGAKVRDFFEKTKDRTKDLSPKVNLSMQSAREAWKRTSKGVLDHNLNVTQATQHIKQLMEGNVAGQKLLKLSQNKWFRRSVIGVSVIAGLSMLRNCLNGFNPKPVIPNSYQRGYDVMNETMTDFGSPVKLDKTASKTITPYYSSSRRGIVTTTKAVTNKNLSLALSSKAIGHTRY